jgi:hypothetical protein
MQRVVLAAALVAAGVAAVAAAAPFTLAPPVVASGPSPFAGCANIGPGTPGAINYVNAEVEPWVDVNPANPNNIIAVWQQDRWSDGGARGLVAGVSHDGGQTWSRTWAPFTFCSGGTVANGGDFERASDPWVTFSPNGHAYQIAINFNGLDLTNAVTVSKSTNGGDTWSSLKTLIRDSGERDSSWAFNDKQSITADPFDANYVYAVWDRLVSPNGKSKASFQGLLNSKTFRGPTWFSRTTDGGQTWEPAREISDPGSHAQTIGNIIDVLPDGTLLDLFTQFVEHKNAKGIRGIHFAVIRSGDKGATWSDEIVIAADNSVGVRDPDTNDPLRTGDSIPDIAVNRHPGTPGFGNAYVVWQGRSSPSATSDDAIFLSRSTDGGLNWSDPIQVDKSPAGVAAFIPAVHVRADGTVAVTYFDLRNNTPDPGLVTDYWIVHSHDGGLTFSSESHVYGPFDMRIAPVARGFFLGDYMGLASRGNTFVPAWVAGNNANTANRTDVFLTSAG